MLDRLKVILRTIIKIGAGIWSQDTSWYLLHSYMTHLHSRWSYLKISLIGPHNNVWYLHLQKENDLTLEKEWKLWRQTSSPWNIKLTLVIKTQVCWIYLWKIWNVMWRQNMSAVILIIFGIFISTSYIIMLEWRLK